MLNRRGFLKGLAALLPTATLLKLLPAAEVVKPVVVERKMWEGIKWMYSTPPRSVLMGNRRSGKDWLRLMEFEQQAEAFGRKQDAWFLDALDRP